MRNFIVVLGILLSLSSCKKEVDSVNEKNKNSQTEEKAQLNEKGIVVVEKIDSLALLKNKAAFLSDASGKYVCQYQLEKGKTYYIHTKSTDNYSVTRNEEKMNVVSETQDKIQFTVLEELPNAYLMKAEYVFTKNKVTNNGKTEAIDTQGVAPTDPLKKKDWTFRKAMMGNAFTFELSRTGKVIKVTGMDAIYARIKNSIQKDFTAKETQELIEMVKKNVINPKLFTEQFQTTMIRFPKEGIRLGESRKEKTDETYTQFTLKSIDDQYVTIVVSANLPPKAKTETQQGVALSASKSGDIKGKLLFNKKTGWLDKGENTKNVSIKMTQTYQGKSLTQTETNINKTVINP